MKVYVWLHTVPNKHELSRVEELENHGKEFELPELMLPRLFDHLMKCGAYLDTGMGRVPVTWLEIDAWQRFQGIELTPFEVNAIKRASVAYVVQMQLAQEPNCPPPVSVVKIDQDALRTQIKSILR